MLESHRSFSIFVFSLGILISTSSCMHCDPTYMGYYYLSDEQKSWINFQNSQVIFRNQFDSVQLFTYSQATGYPQHSFYSCSKCGSIEYYNDFLQFSFSSDSFPALLNLTLEAVYDSACMLATSGSLSISDIELHSWLQIRVPNSFPVNYSTYYTDSLTLNNKTFNSVYYTKSDDQEGIYETIVDRIYFNKELGVIGFQTEDSVLWALSQ